MLSRTHWTGASQTVLGVQAGQLALTRPTQFCREGGREVRLLQQMVHTTMSPVIVSRRNLEHICRKNTLKGSARIRTCTHTLAHSLTHSPHIRLYSSMLEKGSTTVLETNVGP